MRPGGGAGGGGEGEKDDQMQELNHNITGDSKARLSYLNAASKGGKGRGGVRQEGRTGTGCGRREGQGRGGPGGGQGGRTN